MTLVKRTCLDNSNKLLHILPQKFFNILCLNQYNSFGTYFSHVTGLNNVYKHKITAHIISVYSYFNTSVERYDKTNPN